MSRLLSLQEIRDAKPCKGGWQKLIASLGGVDTPMGTLVSIGDIAKSNGAQDALWCCRLIDDRPFLLSLIAPAVERAKSYAAADAAVAATRATRAVVAADAAARAAYSAARAAYSAAYAAARADVAAAERAKQVEDIIRVSPLHAFKSEGSDQ